MKCLLLVLSLLITIACGDSEPDSVSEADAETTAHTPAGPESLAPIDEQISWAAKVKATLEPLIESKLELRNRVEAHRPQDSIRVVFLELPPRMVPKALPGGQIKNVLNPNGAPSRLKVLIRDVIAESRLDIQGVELYNGTLDPDSPTPFQ